MAANLEEDSVKLTFQAVVKGYHECTFTLVPNEDHFVIQRKVGDRGEAFEVLRTSDRRRLGHLQKDLVPILWSDETKWPLSADMSDVVSKIAELEEIDKSREEAEKLLRKEERRK
ncbi:hypothetical protein OS493_012362 [Desmophyllum pertusum]|uniref:Uncharacterized protein n=1 Tax=Desmophyllum pertusum TaxID=174260 RepID=A0A9W9ZRV7_9CNID|nr:hypothetical protein OS493_012362 [Desmophyllum pertusum]